MRSNGSTRNCAKYSSPTTHRFFSSGCACRSCCITTRLGWTMIHAGLAPSWTLRQAQRAALEVERELGGPRHQRLLKNLFGNRPPGWNNRLQGVERHRATINTLTRMRYCDVSGRIDFEGKGTPGTQKPGMYPWFEVPGMRRRETKIVCGHWSALGRFAGLGVY